MKTKFLKLAILFMAFFVTQNINANHLSGGDLSYKCLGGNSYEFTLVVYNELSAQNQSSSIDFYELSYYSNSLGIEPETKVFQVFSTGNGVEVPLYCPGQQNLPNARRVVKYTYVGVINLPQAASDWTFVFQQTARSTVINTAVTNLSTDYIVEAKINTLLAPCNSSPQFNINNHSIVNGYLNQETIANFGGIDPDGDQLKYSLTSPKGQLDELVVYKSGYSANNFISALSTPQIDDNGVMKFTATKNGEIGITDVKIEEIRNGQVIASITRGVQVTTKTTENIAPVLSEWNKEPKLCEGENVNFGSYSFFGSDADSLDKLSFVFFPNQYASWFARQGNSYSLIRKISASDVGVHTFTVTVTDDHCPETRSTEKTYTLDINLKPSVTIGENYIINCDNPLEIKPEISPAGEYTYQWKIWYDSIIKDVNQIPIGVKKALTLPVLSGNQTFSPTKAQKTALLITDQNGCIDTSFVESFDSLNAELSVVNYCYFPENPVSTLFSDLSSSSEYPIVSWKWSIIPENIENDDQNFEYVFENPGFKNVSLTVTNEAGCTKTIQSSINVCEPQIADFSTIGEVCTDKPTVIFSDESNYINGCSEGSHTPGSRTWWFGDGSIERTTGNDTIMHEYKIGGDYEIILKSTTTGGCSVYDTTIVTIGQRPQVDIFQSDSSAFVCSRLDTTFAGVITQNGTGDISYRWVSGKSSVSPTLGTDSTLKANKTGVYTVFIKDEFGCTDSSSVVLYNPVDAKYTYEPVCNLGDSIKLIDLSKSTLPIKEWKWTTSGFVANDSVSMFAGNQPNNYKILLEVKDENGCTDTVSHKVKYLFIENSFFIEKDSIQICATDNVDAKSFTSQAGLSNIDQSLWYLGYGDTTKVAAGDYKLNFKQEGDYSVYHKVIYNSDPAVHNFKCERDTTVMLNVKSEFKIDVFYNRLCLYDSGNFNIERITGDLNVPITKTQWIITNSTANVRDTILDKSFSYYFEYGGFYSIKVLAEDSLGCITSEDASNTVSSRLPKPDLSYTSGKICANELGDFFASVDQTKIEIENVTDYYLIVNNDTIVQGKGNPRTFDASYLFQKTRLNNITYYLEDRKVKPFASHDSLKATCRASTNIELQLIDLPILDVVADTLCPKELVTITNLSRESEWSGPINSFEVLESGNFVSYPSTQKEWESKYSVGGYQPFVLVAKTDSGCVDTLKKDIFVKPAPVADFELMERFAEAFVPLSLYDISKASIGLENDTAQLTSSFYDLGDGTTSNEFDLTHTWGEVKSYLVEHQVENSYGCRDTIVKILDMRPYLDAPNAFSPNGDGNNDYLGLIYKSIIELQEYKIYNRWGQVVFDGGNNLDAVWDGKFKGVDQEVGVYILHVRGLGTYNTQYDFKKNLTLIR